MRERKRVYPEREEEGLYYYSGLGARGEWAVQFSLGVSLDYSGAAPGVRFALTVLHCI